MIELGKTYKDKITGFSGVATGYVQYLSGCHQVLLAPPVNDKGELRGSEWFDEQRLVEGDEEKIVLDNSKNPGFDKEAPKR